MMIKNFVIFFLAMALGSGLTAQTIAGNFSLLANEKIELVGFEGLNTYHIDSTTIGEDGTFRLNFGPTDYGMGLLQSPADQKPLVIVLSGEEVRLRGETLSFTGSIEVNQGTQNKRFVQYATEQPKREQALSAWLFLERMYSRDSLFSVQKEPVKAIEQEKNRLQKEESDFLNSLTQDSYVRWFLPIRKLVSNVSVVAQHRVEEIPATTSALREINYADDRLYKSGLFREAIENHVWFIENSAGPLDTVFTELNVSIDIILEQLRERPQRLNEVTDHLFNLLERRSLFRSAEYLALKVLGDEGCSVDDKVAKQLETYRAMKIGNIAPDLEFRGKMLVKSHSRETVPQKLSELQSPYTLVVFAAGWCPMCVRELPEMIELYDKWSAEGVEVIVVSLDHTEEDFLQFADNMPFLSVCDFKGWDSPMAESYYVFGTPTMFLLNDHREILLRPNSVEHMNAWVDWFLLEKR
nr:redoxin domain-containing protein [Saprospiraceae bacterium]